MTEPNDNRLVRLWLYGLAALIIVMILVGGATRVTDSGLSITEWAPIRGVIPPLSGKDWLTEFDKYKTTTEFQTINFAMTMEQFKTIYWWEWVHRFLGRLIGLAAVLPLIFFWVSGRLPQRMKWPLVGLVALGGLQGAIGWWMVKSGLTGRVDVSQIRLAIHLTMASIILCWTLWLARSIASHGGMPVPSARWQGGVLTAFILLQIFIGGLVAGLDAGMAYNTWPTMNGEWLPEGLLAASPWWSNLTDNAMTVQFTHRITAYLLWFAALAHLLAMIRDRAGSTHARRALLLFALVTLQALAGIVTLVLQVPPAWALMHQFGAVILLAFATAHWYAFAPHRSLAADHRAKPKVRHRAAYGRA